ncbi:hypothetical protein AB0C84_07675 [Actinomadura sp. NPDC048955]|uniref:hypothetical protein n=1 Tax=Actinomadura sp. NPDC048955 TaxID=3158228 RepID=UPI00340F4F02
MDRVGNGLNWHSAAHWGGGRRLPCVHCGHGAFCRDDNGRPCHKTCAETAMRRAAAPDTAPDTAGTLGLGGEAA